ncbi:oligopeptide transporter 4 [Actinidia rufa]|uniref:Oligopeptide transporter 4 n=1 Tax=Actinidia rufa TaxID=165716 RepID=A0A7J0EV41_9ERIC|nr:oligopeptide transporter 4 [Actinidia rufa]
MATLETPPPYTTTNGRGGYNSDEDDVSPVEQVRLTVSNTDDPTLPVWTFRMWFLGLITCALLSSLNQFFSYRTQPVVITVQVATLPMGHFLAAVLPTAKFRIPGFGPRLFSFNPGPFNMKEHVLISIFANTGCAFGFGPAYAVGIVTIIKAFNHRNISFLAGWILIITTQVLGYGWAGLLRKYVVEPAHMWWPNTLVQVSFFRALHEKDESRMSRARFFLIALFCSFSWYLVPGYLFTTLSSISWVCWAFSKSVTAQQIGSGMRGLGLGALTLDWTIVSYLSSPLIWPFFSIVNVFLGYTLITYIVIPIAYWGLDVYGAKKFPIFSSHLFTDQGQRYNMSAIVNKKFEIDMVQYEKQGRINLSMFFALSYGFGFAAIASTLTHVALFYGREIYERFRASYKGKEDIHTRLMRNYKDIPSWWFSPAAWSDNCSLSETEWLVVITEYIMGIIYPGRPIANICFKTYGHMSTAQAVSFLSDFKLGHYMKIPPRSMFLVQLIGTIIAGTVNILVAWWQLTSIENICQDDLLPHDSPWKCPRAMGPVFVWLFHKAFPTRSWIPLINLPVLFGAIADMPPATPVIYNSWILVGTIFNFFIFRYKKKWWQRYNYILSAALDAGVAFMAVLLYFSVGIENKQLNWWGTHDEHCDLATCPTAKGIVVDGCPVKQ